jgi:hypothetical protein
LNHSGAQLPKIDYELSALKQSIINGTYEGPSTLLLHHDDFWEWKKALTTEGRLYVAPSRVALRPPRRGGRT